MRLRQARRGGCDALSVCGVRLVQQLHELVRLTVLDVNIVERAACSLTVTKQTRESPGTALNVTLC